MPQLVMVAVMLAAAVLVAPVFVSGSWARLWAIWPPGF
jgi:hypothetical protein